VLSFFALPGSCQIVRVVICVDFRTGRATVLVATDVAARGLGKHFLCACAVLFMAVSVAFYRHSASEMTYIVSGGALNSTHSLIVIDSQWGYSNDFFHVYFRQLPPFVFTV